MSIKTVFRGKLFTIFFFIPYVCSSAAISIMWVQIFKPAGGVLNTLLQGMGVANPPDWFRDATWFPWMLVVTIAWKAPGYGILMVQAAGAGGMPVASVLSLLLFVVISLVLALNKRLSKLWVSYDY